MKSPTVILALMVGLAGAMPVAIVAWGLWSLSTAMLAVAVACFECLLAGLLFLRWREQHRLARFGYALRYEHMPTHYGPLRGR